MRIYHALPGAPECIHDNYFDVMDIGLRMASYPKSDMAACVLNRVVSVICDAKECANH
jgi:hypothetical protein